MSEIVFVGTSDAFGAGGRRQSAILVRARGGSVLMDCGMTTGGGLNELGIDRNEVDAIVVSHFHGDHFGGIPGLLLAALYEDRRREPLRIAGPPGVEARVQELAHAMGYGLEERDWPFPLVFQELPADRAVEVGPVSVRAFETFHQPHTHPHGLILQAGASSIAYSGDTGWFDELPRRVGACDLFITECTYRVPTFEYHLDLEGLLEHRDRFECGRIILTHLGSEMADRRGRCEFDTADDGLVLRL